MITDEEIRANPELINAKEQEMFKEDPLKMVQAEYLWIKTLKGNFEPLKLNSSQQKIVKVVKERQKEGRPIKIAILKSRQMGTSTLIEAIGYAVCSQWENTNGLVLADDEEGSQYLLDMTHLYNDELRSRYPHLAPKTRHETMSLLDFFDHRSSLRIETAKNPRAGRKYTFRFVHASECAFWPFFRKTMNALGPAIPNDKNTFFFLETTANGMEEFYKFWKHIKKASKQNKTDWIPLFLSWKDHEEYQRPFVSDLQKKEFVESLTGKERSLQKEFDLTFEQMYWRSWKIEDEFGGDVASFEVEFPLTDDQAFKSAAKRVFPELILKPQRKHLMEPKFVGEIEWMSRRSVFMPNDEGDLKVFEPPKKGHMYTIGADSCESATAHDYACGQVFDKTVMRQVAVLHGHIPPHLFAEKLFALGAWYGWALMCPEVNGPGLVTTFKLRDLDYPNICFTPKIDFTDSGEMVDTNKIGWRTDYRTKPRIVGDMVDGLRKLEFTIHDAPTLEECETFVVLGIGDHGHVKHGADVSSYDDRIIALMIAIWMSRELPQYAEESVVSVPDFHITRRTGYG